MRMEEIKDLILDNKYIEAIDILEKIIESDPQNISALSDAGFCYSQTGNLGKAQQKLKLASQYNPKDSLIWQNYGYVLFHLGKLTSAINALKKATTHNPNDIKLNHQLSFLFFKNKDYINALKYLDIAIELSENYDASYKIELVRLKADFYEQIDENKALKIHFDLIESFENDPFSYDKAANIIYHRFKSSKYTSSLNSLENDYKKATLCLREGEIEKAIKFYKKAIKNDPFCYPAYLGISQALYENSFGLRKIKEYPETDEISKLVKNHNQLGVIEKNIINASVYLLQNFVKKLVISGSHFMIVPIDVKLTDYPANKHLRNKTYCEKMPFGSLRGIGGDHGYVGVERLRDILWNIPSHLKFTPACVAHEYAHLIWCKLDCEMQDRINKNFLQAQQCGDFISNYSSFNVEEYFAEYYAYYSRLEVSNEYVLDNDPMMKIFDELKEY